MQTVAELEPVANCDESLLQRIWDGGRVGSAEALDLFSLPLTELAALAHRRRCLAKAAAYGGRGNDIVTYIIDRNINYTNVCNVYCKFCNFYRTESDADAYVISMEELDRKIEELLAVGGNQILIQGGHHPKLSLQWYLDMLSHLRGKFPTVNIHGFSPSEFVHFSKVFDLPVAEVIAQFRAAGLGSIPGGGGEILVDRVRQRISPLKAMSDEWLGVMDAAHRQGLNTTATMMFGHVETLAERIEHLDRIRTQQDRTGGFTAFIAWPFQSEGTKLKAPKAGPGEYLRTQAIARIYLDNVPNIQSGWVTEGPDIGQVGLLHGANDLGSIMMEENVVRQAGARHRMTADDMKRLITELGYEPRQRDVWYRLVH
jgi:cyclic dehypoxanthinyl futalosine synthase